MQLFYQKDILETLQLGEEESYHAAKVLRLKTGDKIHITNGQGVRVYAQITDLAKKNMSIKILEKTESEAPENYTHIAVAPTKNMDRMEWMVEKLTEIGVQEISFVQCQKSERKELKMSRLEKIAVSAMKQSKQNFLPKLNELKPLTVFLKENFASFEKFVAYVDENNEDYLNKVAKVQSKTLVMIGPEGDFAKEELQLLIANNFRKISLGKSVLRTETAAISACNILNILNL